MAQAAAPRPIPQDALAWGVNLLPDAPMGAVVTLARRAEELGFDRCWLYDEGLATRDLWVALTAIGLATERIAIGPGITNPYTRHPGVTAAATASLAELLPGRVFLGIGAGGSLALDPLTLDRIGPVEAIREMIEACRGLWRGDAVDRDAKAFAFRSARIAYGNSDLAIWVAGRGPRVLAAAARGANGVSLDHIHRDFLAASVSHVLGEGAAAGNEVLLAYSATIITTDAALERARGHMTYRLVDSPPPVRDAIGLTESDADAIRAAMGDGLDVAARLVRDEWVFPFVIHGTLQECAATLADRCRQYGFSEFIVPVPDLDVAEETMATAAQVRAQLTRPPVGEVPPEGAVGVSRWSRGTGDPPIGPVTG